MRQSSTSTGGRPLRIGKYEVVAHIATGGMGAIYKAIDTQTRRPVAIKILSAELAARPAMVERFKREGRSALKLRHNNIVAGYECGESNGTLFLALEYVKGADLEDVIARRGRLEPEFARHVAIQAVRALEHAHEHHLVHRDIKPANFILAADKEGRLLVKLVDLGLARLVNEDECRVTNPDATVGTVDYMAPEQARDSAAADIRSDIYSLGCTYYQMLTGKCPFPSGTLVERVMKHREAEPPEVRSMNPEVPAATAAIIAKTMAKDPADRYQTPTELLADLESTDWFAGSSTPPTFRPARSKAAAKALKRRRKQTPVPPEDSATEEFARHGNTEEYPRSEKVAAAKGKRYRDDPEPPRAYPWKTALRACWPWLALGAGILLLALVLWLAVSGAS